MATWERVRDQRSSALLLQVIDERQASIRAVLASAPESAVEAKTYSDVLDIKEAVVELRRRGEVIVQRCDIETICRFLADNCSDPLVLEVVDRLDRSC